MREHSLALSQLLQDRLLVVEPREHRLLQTSLLMVVSRYLIERGELLKVVSGTALGELLSEDSPLSKTFPEFEAWQFHFFYLNAPSKLLESGCNDRFVFNRVQRASAVRDFPTNFKELETLKKDSGLKDMKSCTILSGPFLPFLWNFPNRSIGATRNVAYYSIE